MLAFLAVVLLVLTTIHLYLWRRLVRDTTVAGTRVRRLGGVAVLLLTLTVPAAMIGSRLGQGWMALGLLWLPLMFYLLLTLLLMELPLVGARRWLRRRAAAPTGAVPTGAVPTGAVPTGAVPTGAVPTGAVPATELPAAELPAAAGVVRPALDHDAGRRLLLARGAAIFAGLTAASITGYGVRTALQAPTVDRIRIPLAKLPRTMDGLRIAVVSDIHLGPLAGRSHAQRIVDVVNRLDADLVTIVGDLVDGTVEELEAAGEPLRTLRSKRGVYFVTGNHEYYSGVEDWLDKLPEWDINVLRNERVAIDGLDLAGVNDLTGGEQVAGANGGGTGGPDYAAALDGRDPARPVVLMAHQPVQAREAARHGVDLQLSGHTHGGQMMPFNLAVRLEQPVVAGLGTVDDMPVYVTSGAGFWGPPVRVGVPPTVGLIELRTP